MEKLGRRLMGVTLVVVAGMCGSAAPAGAVREGMLVFDADYREDYDEGGAGTDILAQGVFAVGPGGRGARNISRERPAWMPGRVFSPEGRWLAYHDFPGVRIGPASGRTPGRPVGRIGSSFRAFALSPGGRQLAFSRADLERSFVVRRDGRGLRRLAPGLAWDWSSTGWIAVSRRRGPTDAPGASISVVRPSGRGLREVATTKTGIDISTPGALAWSPGGTKLAVVGDLSTDANNSDWGLWVVDVTTGHRRFVASAAFAGAAQWSPDGRSLAFTRRSGGDEEDIYTVRATGGQPRKLVETSKLFPRAVRRPGGYVYLTSGLEWPRIRR